MCSAQANVRFVPIADIRVRRPTQHQKNVWNILHLLRMTKKPPVFSVFGEQAYFEPIELRSLFSDRLSRRCSSLFEDSGNYRCFNAGDSIQLHPSRNDFASCL